MWDKVAQATSTDIGNHSGTCIAGATLVCAIFLGSGGYVTAKILDTTLILRGVGNGPPE